MVGRGRGRGRGSRENKEVAIGRTVLHIIGGEEVRRRETEHGATAGFAVELTCSNDSRRKRIEKMDGTGLAKNSKVNACGSVENRRRNCGILWSFVSKNGGHSSARGEERKRTKVLTGGSHLSARARGRERLDQANDLSRSRSNQAKRQAAEWACTEKTGQGKETREWVGRFVPKR